MESFPAEHELLALLGEPVLLDEDIPWAYNRLTFSLSVGTRSAEVAIEPGEGYVEIDLADNGFDVVSVSLANVTGLQVEVTADREDLVVVLQGSGVSPVRLGVRPRLRLCWTTGP